MKLVLFLYPVVVYFEWMTHVFSYSLQRGGDLELADLYALNEVLEARYRAQGYEVAWILPGTKGKLWQPHMIRLSQFVTPEPGDRFISTGGGGHRMNLDFIVEQLPLEQIQEVVVGGFLWDQCTKVVARYLRGLGVNAWIDEDITEVILRKRLIWRMVMNQEYPLEGLPFEPWHAMALQFDQVSTYQNVLENPWKVRELDQGNFGIMDYDNHQRVVITKDQLTELINKQSE